MSGSPKPMPIPPEELITVPAQDEDEEVRTLPEMDTCIRRVDEDDSEASPANDPAKSETRSQSKSGGDSSDREQKRATQKHPGLQCAQFSCQNPVGWSQSRSRFAKLCEIHLKAHRVRCAKSASRRRKINQEYREKARMYDVQSMTLSSAHEEIRKLREKLAERERELRRLSSSSRAF